jgi:hypothetical protein
MEWQKYFEMMADWKRLPAYRAEPRIDSLIGYYLPDFAADFLRDPIIGIIPELPIRLGTVKPDHEGASYADRSYKVDFYLLGRSGVHYFVEFKTDSASRRPEQDAYLIEAQDVGMAAIVEGICRIADASSYRKKYAHLLDQLCRIGIMDQARQFSGRTNKIEVVYVQPGSETGSSKCIDFLWLAEWLRQRGGPDNFEVELAGALMKWSKD